MRVIQCILKFKQDIWRHCNKLQTMVISWRLFCFKYFGGQNWKQ